VSRVRCRAGPARPARRPAGRDLAVVTSSDGHGVSCAGSGGTLKPLNYGAIVTFLTAAAG
jgi:hypothetical protein